MKSMKMAVWGDLYTILAKSVDESFVFISDFWETMIHRQKCGDFEDMGILRTHFP